MHNRQGGLQTTIHTTLEGSKWNAPPPPRTILLIGLLLLDFLIGSMRVRFRGHAGVHPGFAQAFVRAGHECFRLDGLDEQG